MEPWFEPQMAGWIGGIGGSAVGVIFGGIGGGLGGYLASQGKAKRLVLGLWMCAVVLGVCGLGGGVYALTGEQPYHVWYPFLLLGGLLCVLGTILTVVMSVRYREADQRQLAAEELRRSGG